MLTFHPEAYDQAVPIFVLEPDDFEDWLSEQEPPLQNWCKVNRIEGKPGQYCLLPDALGFCQGVCVWASRRSMWTLAYLFAQLPDGHYCIEENDTDVTEEMLALGWALAGYRFIQYKSDVQPVNKVLCLDADYPNLEALVASIGFARDLINVPAEDCGPEELVSSASAVFEAHEGNVQIISGEDLLEQNFPAIYAVGKGSHRPSQLFHGSWGDKNAPKLVLVGKGVCFDTGGLGIKPQDFMMLMKKDMGGAAIVLGLAQMVMATELPVQLHVIIPCVENAVGPNAYRPGDVVMTRKGITVEITDTDAEGRMILSDALTYASELEPDLLIDFATLTGAARVALGTDCPAMFTKDETLMRSLRASGDVVFDPVWPLPLFEPYIDELKSEIADCRNTGKSRYGGAITAALFLEQFVSKTTSWVHFDVMAWHTRSRPGRPEGGEAMGLRAVWQYLEQRYERQG